MLWSVLAVFKVLGNVITLIKKTHTKAKLEFSKLLTLFKI